MKKNIQLLLFSTLLLSGCTYTDTLSAPPKIKWDVPQAIEPNTTVDLEISPLNQAAENLEATSFVLQKQGEAEGAEIPFTQDSNGKIQIPVSFKGEGIYNLSSVLKTDDQTIQPTRQIIVGKASATASEKEKLADESNAHH